MKTIQELIDNREALDFFYEERLIALLSSYTSRKTKESLKKLVKTKFYSSFDGKWFSTKLKITGDTILFDVHNTLYSQKLNQMRKELLLITEQDT